MRRANGGRAALVTGGSSGIGLAIARMLGEQGYGLTVAARRPDKLEDAVKGLARRGLRRRGRGRQHGRRGGRQAGRRRPTGTRFGRMDVLINNAGVGIGGPIADHETKKLDMQLNVNLRGVYLTLRESIPMLKEAGAEHSKALVVNTASIAGKIGQPWLAAYSATKGARRRAVAGGPRRARRRRHPGDRVLPRLRRHADDRLGRGSGAQGRDDPARGHRRGGALPARDLARVHRPGDPVHPAGRRPSKHG